MPRNRKKGQQEKLEPAQQYDTTFKDWIRTVAPEVLPVLLPGAVYEGTLDVEAIKPIMRMDKVYKAFFPERTTDKECIVDIEFQTNYDPDLTARLLVYNAILYYENRLPVISLVIYPFKTTLAGSPLVISSGNRKIITFDFVEIALFQEKAEYYVKEHIIAMYPMLPTMQGVDHILIKEAMDELFKICREEVFARQFVWMELLLERTETIALHEKERIRRELQVYDSLWESHPRVKQLRAEIAASKAEIAASKAEVAASKAQFETQGEIHGLQHAIVTFVRVRYPNLTTMAQQKVAHLNKLDALSFLFEQIAAQTTEDGVRALLIPTVA